MGRVEKRETRAIHLRCKYCHSYLKDIPKSAAFPGIASGQMSFSKHNFFIHLFLKHLSKTSYVPGTMQITRNTAITRHIFSAQWAYPLAEGGKSKVRNRIWSETVGGHPIKTEKRKSCWNTWRLSGSCGVNRNYFGDNGAWKVSGMSKGGVMSHWKKYKEFYVAGS